MISPIGVSGSEKGVLTSTISGIFEGSSSLTSFTSNFNNILLTVAFKHHMLLINFFAFIVKKPKTVFVPST